MTVYNTSTIIVHTKRISFMNNIPFSMWKSVKVSNHLLRFAFFRSFFLYRSKSRYLHSPVKKSLTSFCTVSMVQIDFLMDRTLCCPDQWSECRTKWSPSSQYSDNAGDEKSGGRVGFEHVVKLAVVVTPKQQ
jgi:hypothetical protein